MGNNKTLKPYSNLVKYNNYYTYDNDVQTTDTYEPYSPYDKYLTWDTYGVKKAYTPQTITTNFLNYNDPYEINSVADVILTTFNPKMKRANLGGLEKIPILNIYTGMYELAWKTTFKPLIYGKGFEQPWEKIEDKSYNSWKDNYITRVGTQLLTNTRGGTIILNNLINVGETLDVIANPVKALVLGKDGKLFSGDAGQREDVVDAMGWGENGRVNYDADTGHWATDMLLEFGLDPLNWFSALSSGTTKVVATTVKETIEEALGEGSEQLAKKLSKEIVEKFMRGEAKDLNEAAIKVVGSKWKDLALGSASKGIDLDQSLKLLTDYSQQLVSKQAMLETSKILYGVSKVSQTVNGFEKGLMRAALTGSGVYMPYLLLKEKGFKPLMETFLNRSMAVLKPYIQEDEFGKYLDLSKYNEIIAKLDNEVDIANTTGLLKNKLITKNHAEKMFDVTIQKHIRKVHELMTKYTNDPIKFQVELTEYLKFADVDDALVRLREILEEINTFFDGKYKHHLEYLERVEEVFSRTAIREASAQRLAKITDEKNILKRLSIKFKMLEQNMQNLDNVLPQVQRIIADVIKKHPNLKTGKLKYKIIQELRSQLFGSTATLYKTYANTSSEIIGVYLQSQLHLMTKFEDILKNVSDQLTPIIQKAKTIDTITLPKSIISETTVDAVDETVFKYIADLEAREKLVTQKVYDIKNLDDLLSKADKQTDFIDELRKWNKVENVSRYTQTRTEAPIKVPEAKGFVAELAKNIFGIDAFRAMQATMVPGTIDEEAFDLVREILFQSIGNLEERLLTFNELYPVEIPKDFGPLMYEMKNYVYSKCLNKGDKRKLLEKLGNVSTNLVSNHQSVLDIRLLIHNSGIFNAVRMISENAKIQAKKSKHKPGKAAMLFNRMMRSLEDLDSIKPNGKLSAVTAHTTLDNLYFAFKDVRYYLKRANIEIDEAVFDDLDIIINKLYSPLNSLKAEALTNTFPELTEFAPLNEAIYRFIKINENNFDGKEYIKAWVNLQNQYAEYKKGLIAGVKKLDPNISKKSINKQLDLFNEGKFFNTLIEELTPTNPKWATIPFTHKDNPLVKITGIDALDATLKKLFKLKYTGDNSLLFSYTLRKVIKELRSHISKEAPYTQIDAILLRALNGAEGVKGLKDLFPKADIWNDVEFNYDVSKELLKGDAKVKSNLKKAMLNFMELDLDVVSHDIYTDRWYALDREFQKYFSAIGKQKYHPNQANLYKIYKQKFKPIKPGFIYKDGESVLLQGQVVYQAHLEKTYTNLLIMNNKHLGELVQQFNTNYATGGMLRQLFELSSGEFPSELNEIAELVPLIQGVDSLSKGYANYAMFINTILMTPEIPNDIKTTLLSTLQNYANRSTIDFSNRFDYNLNRILESVDTFRYSSKEMSKSLKVEALLDANDGAIRKQVDEFLKDAGVSQHTGLYDTVATYFIMKEHLPEMLVNNGKTKVILDIETTSLKWYQGEIYDIGMVVINPDGSIRYTKPFKKKIPETGLGRPTPEALNHVYSTSPDILPEDRLTDLVAKYADGVDTEEELLESVLNELRALRDAGEDVEILGFNSDKFDMPYISGKLTYQDKKFFNSFDKLDVLQLLKKKNGFEALTPQQKEYIKNTLRTFVDNQVADSAPFLIDLKPGTMANYLKKIAATLESEAGKRLLGDTQVHIDFLKNTASSIIDDIVYFDNTNKALKNLVIDKESLAEGFFKKPIQEYIEKQFELPSVDTLYNEAGYVGLKQFIAEHMSNYDVLPSLNHYTATQQDEIIKAYFKFLEDKKLKISSLYAETMNISSLMYGTIDDIIYKFGVEKVIDHDIILKWFHYKELNKLPNKTQRALTGIGKYLNNYAKCILNAKALEPLEYEIRLVFEMLTTNAEIQAKLFPQAILERYGRSVEILKHLKFTEGDLVGKWVGLKYYYDQLKNKNILTSDIKGLIGKDVLKLLEDDSSLRKLVFPKGPNQLTDEDLMAAFLNVEPGENLKSSLYIKQITQEFRDGLLGGFEALNKALDETDAFRGRNQAISAALSKVADAYEAYWEVVNEAYIIDEVSKDGTSLFVKSYKKYTNDLALMQTHQVLNLADEDLFALMVHYAPWIELDAKDLPLAMLDTLNNRTSNLNKLGINVTVDDATDRLYISLDSSIEITTFYDKTTNKSIYVVDGRTIERPKLKSLDFTYKEHKALGKSFAESMDQFAFLSRGTSVGSMGEVATLEWVRSMYVKLPESVRKTMPPLEQIVREDLFDGIRYNFINLGSIKSRAVKHENIATGFMKTLKTNAEMTSSFALTKSQYISMYFDKSFSINNGEFMRNTADLLQALQAHPEYTLAALVEDDKYGCQVIKLNVKTVEQLDNARRLNPIIIPSHTFSTMTQVVNGDIMKDTALKYWNRIIYIYKTGYLLDPGVWLRNYIDSTLKNIISTGSIIEPFKEQRNAVQAINKYNTSVEDIIKLDAVTQFQEQLKLKGVSNLTAEEILYTKLDAAALFSKYHEIQDDIVRLDIHGRFTQENLKYYFEKMNPAMTLETYKIIDGFIKDGPSAGMVSAWNKYYKTNKKGDSEEELNSLWNTFVHYSSKIMSPNEHIEQISRLSEFLILSKRGLTNTEAFYQISKTHFDYSLRSTPEKIAELIFPFYTFSMRNLEYWVDVALEKPWAIRNIDNAMEPIWNFDGHEYYEYTHNASLQYQILAGNIPLTDMGLTLKLSPSFMDAFGIVVNPIGALDNRFARPYQTLLSGESITSKTPLEALYELPVIGAPLERYTKQAPGYYDKTKNPLNLILPGTFGATKRWANNTKKTKKYYPKKSYSKRQSRTKYYNQYSFSRKYYSTGYNPNRYFTPKGFGVGYSKGKPKMYNYINNRNFHSNSGFYKKHYNNKGKSRLKSRMVPVNSYTLKYRIKDYSHY